MGIERFYSGSPAGGPPLGPNLLDYIDRVSLEAQEVTLSSAARSLSFLAVTGKVRQETMLRLSVLSRVEMLNAIRTMAQKGLTVASLPEYLATRVGPLRAYRTGLLAIEPGVEDTPARSTSSWAALATIRDSMTVPEEVSKLARVILTMDFLGRLTLRAQSRVESLDYAGMLGLTTQLALYSLGEEGLNLMLERTAPTH